MRGLAGQEGSRVQSCSRSAALTLPSLSSFSLPRPPSPPSLRLLPPLRTCFQSFTGKSSLTVQFVDSHFVDSYYPTIENTFQKVVKYKGQDFHLDIIDTAGQVRRLPTLIMSSNLANPLARIAGRVLHPLLAPCRRPPRLGPRLLGLVQVELRHVHHHPREDSQLHGQRERPHGARRQQE